MKVIAVVPVVLAAAVLLVAATASATPGNVGFGFNARDIGGFPTGAAMLTGGGAYNPVSGFVNSAGGFRCHERRWPGSASGCLAGEGVRWDTVDLRRSTNFKCTGAAAEIPEDSPPPMRTRSGLTRTSIALVTAMTSPSRRR